MVSWRRGITRTPNIDRALAQQNQAIDDFNEQLSQDNTAQSPIIYDAKDCQHINVNTKKLIQPRDIIAPNANAEFNKRRAKSAMRNSSQFFAPNHC